MKIIRLIWFYPKVRHTTIYNKCGIVIEVIINNICRIYSTFSSECRLGSPIYFTAYGYSFYIEIKYTFMIIIHCELNYLSRKSCVWCKCPMLCAIIFICIDLISIYDTWWLQAFKHIK